MKHVKSTDPIKKSVVAALKVASGANKITLVKDHEDGTFSGHCLKGNRSGYESLGTFTVDFDNLNLFDQNVDIKNESNGGNNGT